MGKDGAYVAARLTRPRGAFGRGGVYCARNENAPTAAGWPTIEAFPLKDCTMGLVQAS
jgi:hypothetical protein